MASGFFDGEGWQYMEDIGNLCFQLLSEKFIVPSGDVCSSKYKVNDAVLSCLEEEFSMHKHLRAQYAGKLTDASGETRYLSLLRQDTDQMTFEAIQTCENLRTLLLLGDYGSRINQVPREIFLNLSLLRVLDLSRTHISELPASIRHAKSMRYLDVSETLIRRLPESIACLSFLQTLKLRHCLNLDALPKGMKKLWTLRHLDVDIVRQLMSMPAGMGNLTQLRTLQAFLVSKEDGCDIGELKNMNNLSGSFYILGLENITNGEEAKEADSMQKQYIDELQLRWRHPGKNEEEILECLQPSSFLKKLKIQFYGGLRLPSWISYPSFAELESITLFECRNCQFLPSMGELPSLKNLSIVEMNKVKEISHQFCRNGMSQWHPAFPRLEKLEITVMLDLEEWVGIEDGDFPCLRDFIVEYCPKLVALPLLSCLTSLKPLEINHCAELQTLQTLPTSLEFLQIRDCPILKECCCKPEGEDWCNIAHVTIVWIDHQEISSSSECWS